MGESVRRKRQVDGQRGARGEGSKGDDVDFFFQAEDGIRDLVRSRGLGDVYKRQRNTGAFLSFKAISRISQKAFLISFSVSP